MPSELEAERRRADQAERFAATLSRIGAAGTLQEALAVLARDAIAMLGGQAGAVRVYGAAPDETGLGTAELGAPGHDGPTTDGQLQAGGPYAPAAPAATHTAGEAAALGALAYWVNSDGTLESADHPETLPGTVAGDLRAGGPARLIPDLWDLHPGLAETTKAVLRRGMRSSIAVPIEVRGRRIGSLHVDHPDVGRFSEADLAVAQALATMAGATIERARLEERVRALIREQAARAEAQEAQRRLGLLGEVSTALATSLDYETTLRTALHAIVPTLADQCAIDMVATDGSFSRLLLVDSAASPAPVSPAGETGAPGAETGEMARLAQRYPPLRGTLHPVTRALETGKAELLQDLPEGHFEQFAQNDEHAGLMRRLGSRSMIVVPMVARGRCIGVLSAAMSASGRRYAPHDLPLFEELGRRCALAVDNARLYGEAQEQAAIHVQLNAALREAAEERDRALRDAEAAVALRDRALAEAEEALGLRDKFLSLASHELRTPITSLRGYAQLLLRQYRRRGDVDQEHVQRALELIDHQSDKLVRLAMQLLDTSRIETGRLVLERRPVDVAGLAREVVQNIRQLLALTAPVLQVQHRVELEGPPEAHAEVDRTRLEQVLVSLLDNAMKYSPNGGDVTLTVRPPREGAVRLSVRDRGIGVPPAHRELIFDRFYQVQKRDNPSGMGLGLYVSRQIVELHGGTLTAEFPDDGGSLFIITLPVKAPKPGAGDGVGAVSGSEDAAPAPRESRRRRSPA